MDINVVIKNDGTVNSLRISRLIDDISILYLWSIETILITSGDIAAGQSEISSSKKNNVISSRRLWAADGEVKLSVSFRKIKHPCRSGVDNQRKLQEPYSLSQCKKLYSGNA